MIAPPDARSVVVAVDGSPESLAALEWAIEHAHARNLRLRIVTAFRPVSVPSTDSSGGYWEAMHDAQERARERVAAAMQHLLDRHRLDVHHVVALGPIATVLATHTHDAEVTVVGTRSNRGWRRWLRPSTTNRITGLLTSPIVSISPGSAPSSRSGRSDGDHAPIA